MALYIRIQILIHIQILFYHYLLRSLQMPMTVRNTGLEKQALIRRLLPLGIPSRRDLCWGVRYSRASAWIPHLSSVQDGFNNHCCFCSHHRAWSDQSCFISIKWRKRDTKENRTLFLSLKMTKLLFQYSKEKTGKKHRKSTKNNQLPSFKI